MPEIYSCPRMMPGHAGFAEFAALRLDRSIVQEKQSCGKIDHTSFTVPATKRCALDSFTLIMRLQIQFSASKVAPRYRQLNIYGQVSCLAGLRFWAHTRTDVPGSFPEIEFNAIGRAFISRTRGGQV